MTELWLNFTDLQGEKRRIRVERDEFTIGRLPDNDLAVPDSRLSREHARIRRYSDQYVLADLGSSNGTTVNGSPVTDPVTLKDGDVFDLGGGMRVKVEFVSEQSRPAAVPVSEPKPEKPAETGFPTALLLVIPVLGMVILLCVGGAFFLSSESGGRVVRDDGPDIVATTPEEDGPEPSPRGSSTPKESPADSPSKPSNTDAPPTPQVSGETQKVEQNSAQFLRRIALNDPNAFLSSKQVAVVASRVGQIKGSSALADNLKAVKRDAAQFETLANAQGFKAQFLAAAALTKLGNSKGDPLATAKSMLPVLGDLRVSLGNSLADDNLLIMADFLRREAGRKPSLQTILEAIPKSKTIRNANPREIRTIWFLKDNGKITDEYFEFALRFLAIGTITQNPKDFGVNSEPVIFN